MSTAGPRPEPVAGSVPVAASVSEPVSEPVSEVVALEEVAAAGWPAPSSTWLGRWLLRAGEGWTRRANSTLVLGDPGLPLDAALARVRAWYEVHGLPAAFSLPLPDAAALDDELAARGFAAELDTHVLTAPITALTDGARGDATPSHAVRVDATPPPGWDRVYRGGAPLPPVARRILTAPPCVAFASVVGDDGAVVATGRGVVTGRRLGVAAIEVVPRLRGRGLAAAATRALADWGAAHGADVAYLQVAAGNTPALALYAKLGFTRHHTYRQRVHPAAS